ncbi:hypothetical protein BKA93DRAFT_828449 [Sparassis latifolia]
MQRGSIVLPLVQIVAVDAASAICHDDKEPRYLYNPPSPTAIYIIPRIVRDAKLAMLYTVMTRVNPLPKPLILLSLLNY